jgi:anti-sigma regulatory factor (Ser/Thr protein kinase)
MTRPRKEHSAGWRNLRKAGGGGRGQGSAPSKRVALDLPCTPEAVPEARRAIADLDEQIEAERATDLSLLASELITNSVRHAETTADCTIGFQIELTEDLVRVEVRDPGSGFRPQALPGPRRGHPGGWGLFLVDRLAENWGVLTDGATVVWFEMSRAGTGAELGEAM